MVVTNTSTGGSDSANAADSSSGSPTTGPAAQDLVDKLVNALQVLSTSTGGGGTGHSDLSSKAVFPKLPSQSNQIVETTGLPKKEYFKNS